MCQKENQSGYKQSLATKRLKDKHIGKFKLNCFIKVVKKLKFEQNESL